MPRIAISYRRDDSGVITGRIFDRLVARYGREAIFRDIDDIPIGVDFRTHIDEVLAATDVLIAIVGPNWAGPSASQSRLSNEADPVRVEIETALRKKVPLIPVLVLGAAMPTITQLPESLRDFAYRNAVQLDAGQDFDVHMARLLRAVDGILGRAAETARPLREKTAAPRSRPPAAKRHGILIASAVGVVLAGTLIVGWLFGLNRLTFSLPQDTGSITTNTAPPSASAPLTRPAVPASKNAGPTEAESLLWKLVKDSNNPGEFEQYLREYPDGHFAEAAHAKLASLHPTALVPSPDQETIFWQSISNSKTAADFEEYLRKYPQGQFAGLARNRLAALRPPPSQVLHPQPAPGITAAEALKRAKDAEAPHYMANGKWGNDFIEALRWYRISADQGNAEAQTNVGLDYDDGLGTARDYAEAVRWYRMAVSQNYADAELFLARMYEEGRGVRRDYSQAMDLYRRAAAQGSGPASYAIGKMYQSGRGTPRDMVQARSWLAKAKAQGFDGPHE